MAVGASRTMENAQKWRGPYLKLRAFTSVNMNPA
jgi:hypothetical protein